MCQTFFSSCNVRGHLQYKFYLDYPKTSTAFSVTSKNSHALYKSCSTDHVVCTYVAALPCTAVLSVDRSLMFERSMHVHSYGQL